MGNSNSDADAPQIEPKIGCIRVLIQEDMFTVYSPDGKLFTLFRATTADGRYIFDIREEEDNQQAKTFSQGVPLNLKKPLTSKYVMAELIARTREMIDEEERLQALPNNDKETASTDEMWKRLRQHLRAKLGLDIPFSLWASIKSIFRFVVRALGFNCPDPDPFAPITMPGEPLQASLGD
jgi:hypothetical protein